MPLNHWKYSLRQTFRILPQTSPHLQVFLNADGKGQAEILGLLPFDAARSQGDGGTPDAKRYRDPRYVYESVGLLYETAEGIVRLTDLGKVTREWLPLISSKNSHLLCRHAAYALAAVQLRNPTRPGQEYAEEMEVFPISFIWQAMLNLDNRISSDEMNRVILRTRNKDDLSLGIEKIRSARASGNIQELGEELVTGASKNDRIIPWMAMSSFGWTCLSEKDADPEGFYTIKPKMIEVIRQAVSIPRRHRQFNSVPEYVEFISRCASLPPDLR